MPLCKGFQLPPSAALLSRAVAAAAQQQHFRPKDIHHVHNGLAEIFLVLRHDGLCGIVARAHGVIYGFCGDAFFVQQAFRMRGRSL